MKVQIVAYNIGQPSQFFGLVRLEQNGGIVERYPLHYAPKWKTAKGAERYAKKNAYELVTA